MRILALDIGTVRVGVAISDEERRIASPLATIDAKPVERASAAIAEYVRQLGVERIVFGLPLELDGREGRASKRTRRFIAAVDTQTGVPSEPWDERMTSIVAERALIEADMSRKKRKAVVDQLAATLILQSWLDARSHQRSR